METARESEFRRLLNFYSLWEGICYRSATGLLPDGTAQGGHKAAHDGKVQG